MQLQQLDSLSSPLSTQQVESLKQLAVSSSGVELSWISGYLAGISQATLGSQQPQVATSASLTVLYGSQTGNAKGVASEIAAAATAQGITVNLVSMGQYKSKKLKYETHLQVGPPS